MVFCAVGKGVDAILGELDAGAVANDAAPAPAAEAPKEEAAPAPAASGEAKTSPAVRKLLSDNGLDAAQVPASGDRLTKEDVEKRMEQMYALFNENKFIFSKISKVFF